MQSSGKLKVFVGSTKKKVTTEAADNVDEKGQAEQKNSIDQIRDKEIFPESDSVSNGVASLTLSAQEKRNNVDASREVEGHGREVSAQQYIWRVICTVHRAVQEFGVDPLFTLLGQHKNGTEGDGLSGAPPRNPLNFDFGAFEKLNRRFVFFVPLSILFADVYFT